MYSITIRTQDTIRPQDGVRMTKDVMPVGIILVLITYIKCVYVQIYDTSCITTKK